MIDTLLALVPDYGLALIFGTLVAQVIPGGTDIRTIGAINAILPSFTVPKVPLHDTLVLVEGAFAVAIIGLLEALAIGRSFGPRTETRFVANQEVIGQGLSNIAGSFFGAYASSGSFTRSGVNFESGARTPIAAICSGLSALE